MEEKDFSQLRFDISENVRLHPQQAGIGSLLDLNLYPEVEILDKGNHLKIQGYLRLRGHYLAEDEDRDSSKESNLLELEQNEAQEEISYIIPVEITLPADRAQQDQLSAEVESFDYTVLSPFELQIEAILAIDGLMPEERQRALESEEIGVTPTFSGLEVQNTFSDENDDERLEEEKAIPTEAEQIIEEQKDLENVHEQPPDTKEEKVEHVTDEVIDQRAKHMKEDSSEEDVTEEDVSADETEESAIEQKTEAEEKWSSWLLREGKEDFTSIRMAIAQQEDTLESLAEKYGVSTSHLQRLNRFSEQGGVTKGQIIHLPQCKEETASHTPTSNEA
ncbi:LysM peptidoglycan-binding domain-containing protein [Seinonella peptonophila]|uniref:LysM peptidoglycan-binding domain-containing protein n=1 Tax=Seinonella peptonophila TaxID=112248 RepID=UPI00093544B2|nr:LysM domain-containing protein [Seinonella peptonophila]